jgi:hypothetical protein
MVRGVYRLTCDDPSLNYYGSSDNIYKRQIKHKSDNKLWKNGNIKKYCSSYKLYEVGGVEVELVFECPDYISKREMEEIEQTYIENDECVNSQRAFRTEEERKEQKKKQMKEYGLTDKRKEYMKLYNQNDKAKEYIKEYKQSEKYKEQQRLYRLKKKSEKIKSIE